MKKSTFLVLIISIIILTSCSLQKGYLIFQGKQNEIIATQAIKDYMKLNPKPSIVLKAPNSENKSTQADPNSYIYNAIEKELLLGGFEVKDRGLFNEVVGKSKDIDYNEIKRLTGTSLILELVNVSTNLQFSTNKYYLSDGKEKIANYNLTVYGAVIEFKLTLIETNQYAGSYSFYYTPCTELNDDCNCKVLYKELITGTKIYSFIDPCTLKSNYSKTYYEYVSQDAMTEFVRNGVRLMIKEIKQ